MDTHGKTRRQFLGSLGLGAVAATAGRVLRAAGGAGAAKPNVLMVIADDMTWRDCEPYGNREVKTPHMARLAREGIRFDSMFTATAMCAPTRQQLYTGMFPVRNGAYPNHSAVYPGVKSLVHHLKALGYRVGLIGKTHFKPRGSYPFEILPGGKKGASNAKAIAEFVNRSTSQPYCLIVCSNEPHGPWNRGDATAYDARKLTVPPYIVDNAATRQGLTKYYAEITFLDGQLGACMRIVDDSGRKDDTLVVFTSEQGSSFPFGGKWTCYDTGLKTAFILRWPARVRPGSSTQAMAQYVDVVPTLIEAAGGDPTRIDTGRPDAKGYRGFDGKSFLAVLDGKSDKHRAYVYGAHTTRGIIRGTECYPVRSVRSATHKLIRNLNHTVKFNNAICGSRGILASWAETGKTNPAAAARARFYQHRPAEELYDVAKDPYELHNVADDPAYAQAKAELSKQLDAWMAQQGDQGAATEMRAKERQGRRGKARRPAKPKPARKPGA